MNNASTVDDEILKQNKMLCKHISFTSMLLDIWKYRH